MRNICKPELFLQQTFKTAEKEQSVLCWMCIILGDPALDLPKIRCKKKGKNIGRKKKKSSHLWWYCTESRVIQSDEWMSIFAWLFVFASFINARLLRRKPNTLAIQLPGSVSQLSHDSGSLSLQNGGWSLGKVYCVVFHFNTLPTLPTQCFRDWGWQSKVVKSIVW